MERYGEEEVPEGEPHEEVGVSRGRRCGSKESCPTVYALPVRHHHHHHSMVGIMVRMRMRREGRSRGFDG